MQAVLLQGIILLQSRMRMAVPEMYLSLLPAPDRVREMPVQSLAQAVPVEIQVELFIPSCLFPEQQVTSGQCRVVVPEFPAAIQLLFHSRIITMVVSFV